MLRIRIGRTELHRATERRVHHPRRRAGEQPGLGMNGCSRNPRGFTISATLTLTLTTLTQFEHLAEQVNLTLTLTLTLNPKP